jgi:hypothetical protein
VLNQQLLLKLMQMVKYVPSQSAHVGRLCASPLPQISNTCRVVSQEEETVRADLTSKGLHYSLNCHQLEHIDVLEPLLQLEIDQTGSPPF